MAVDSTTEALSPVAEQVITLSPGDGAASQTQQLAYPGCELTFDILLARAEGVRSRMNSSIYPSA